MTHPISFLYLRDPLFLVSAIIYMVNRQIIKPWWPNTFSGSYLNDVLALPFSLPIMVWILRRIGRRPHDLPPTTTEITALLITISVWFEIILPLFHRKFIADPRDILSYVSGALIAVIFWRWYYRPGSQGCSPV